MKTERVVEYQKCVEKPTSLKNKFDVTVDGLELWIYGSVPCVDIDAVKTALS